MFGRRDAEGHAILLAPLLPPSTARLSFGAWEDSLPVTPKARIFISTFDAGLGHRNAGLTVQASLTQRFPARPPPKKNLGTTFDSAHSWLRMRKGSPPSDTH